MPQRRNELWPMYLMHEQLSDGRCIRLFNLIDDFNREALAIDADFSLPALRVIRIVRYHPETAAGHGRVGLLLQITEIGGNTDGFRAVSSQLLTRPGVNDLASHQAKRLGSIIGSGRSTSSYPKTAKSISCSFVSTAEPVGIGLSLTASRTAWTA